MYFFLSKHLRRVGHTWPLKDSTRFQDYPHLLDYFIITDNANSVCNVQWRSIPASAPKYKTSVTLFRAAWTGNWADGQWGWLWEKSSSHWLPHVCAHHSIYKQTPMDDLCVHSEAPAAARFRRRPSRFHEDRLDSHPSPDSTRLNSTPTGCCQFWDDVTVGHFPISNRHKLRVFFFLSPASSWPTTAPPPPPILHFFLILHLKTPPWRDVYYYHMSGCRARSCRGGTTRDKNPSSIISPW